MGLDIKKSINLHNISCPMNFVKTKAALAELQQGELLEVLLDEGEAILNVPRSLKDEGHQVINVENLGETFKVIIKKG
ncbi:MAG: sulfurtransferase TusA family protein [Nitrospinae bacterium]|nr:sulfurtransferase TusA family protein [Nitrospinota bacterium]